MSKEPPRAEKSYLEDRVHGSPGHVRHNLAFSELSPSPPSPRERLKPPRPPHAIDRIARKRDDGRKALKVHSQSNITPISEDDPKVLDEELRQTWRQPPKVSHKLPAAFNMLAKGTSNTKPSKLSVKNYNNLKIASQKKRNIENYHEAVGAEEYKQVQHLLDPIKVDEKRKVKMGKALNKIDTYDLPNFLDVKEFGKKANHLEPLEGKNKHSSKKGSEGYKKVNINKEQFRRNKSVSPRRDFRILLDSRVRLEDMITLGILKENRMSGCVKKMLHAPSLRLFAIKEIPLSNRESRQRLKEWITEWECSLNDALGVINIYGTFWNSPEGCVSVVTDYANAASLCDLLNSTGALPEAALKELAKQGLAILDRVHRKTGRSHGCLIPTQILFNQYGKIHLNLGLSERISNSQKDKETYSSYLNEAISLYDPTNSSNKLKRLISMEKTGDKWISNNEKGTNQDIMDLGYLLIICGTGGLEIINTEELKNLENKTCCLLHSSKITELHNPPTLADYFTQNNRFSPEFLSFLCATLRFAPLEQQNIQTLRAHPWLTTTTQNTYISANVSLRELIQMGRNWNSGVLGGMPNDYMSPNNRQLERVCDAMLNVLPSCLNYERIVNSFIKHRHNPNLAEELANDLQIDCTLVWKQILLTIATLQKKPKI